MKVTIKHLMTVRKAHAADPSQDMAELYGDMVATLAPKITPAMVNSTGLIIDGNTVEEAAEILGISKVAVSQSAVKGLNRLAEFWIAIGGDVPQDLNESFNMATAKRHIDFFAKALSCYSNPQQTINW